MTKTFDDALRAAFDAGIEHGYWSPPTADRDAQFAQWRATLAGTENNS